MVGACNQIYGLDSTRVRDLEPPPCATVQFSAPIELEQFDDEHNNETEFDPQLSATGLELWYAAQPEASSGPSLLFRGERASTDEPFTVAIVDLVGMNARSHADPALTADGRRMIFRVDTTPPSLFEAVRQDGEQFPFDEILPVNGFAQFGSLGVESFDLTWDGLRMYIAVKQGQLWLAQRDDRNKPFTKFIDLGMRNVHFPTISGDELELFYTLYDMGSSGHSLYRRERADVDSPFGAEALVLDDGADPDIAPTSSQMIVGRDKSLALLQRRCDD